MSTDRELLELAAKAAGYNITWGNKFTVGGDEVDCTDLTYITSDSPDELPAYWNPLDGDGDALRLAVDLGMTVNPYDKVVFVSRNEDEPTQMQRYGDDRYAATRRAIVRAAAEIGRAKP